MCIRDRYGLDINSGTIHRPTQKDYMSYCSPRWISLYTHARLIDNAVFSPTSTHSPLRIPEPVSYTHLDVYKRQTVDWLGSIGWSPALRGRRSWILASSAVLSLHLVVDRFACLAHAVAGAALSLCGAAC